MEGGIRAFPNSHRKLLDSLKEEEKRPSKETTERRASAPQELDQSLGREKKSLKESGSSQDVAQAPRRVPWGAVLHQKASSRLWGHGPQPGLAVPEGKPGTHRR